MKKQPSMLVVVCSVLLSSSLLVENPTFAQISPGERAFRNPKPEVEIALQNLRASLSGRLPILEGFVETTGESLQAYENGYYQYVLQAISDPSGGTVVRVSAKITAWYSNANPAESGYRALPSNGRLETDLLDRLEKSLAGNRAESAPPSKPVPASAPSPASPTSTLKHIASNAPAASKFPDVSGVAVSSGIAPGVSAPGLKPAGAVADEPDLASLTQRREEAEKRMKELNNEVQNLEEILHNQAHPNNLVVVQKSGTPVFARPQKSSQVLFLADTEDEFEMLDLQGSWVHIQIAGLSRGWIRRSQVDLPEELARNSSKASTPDLGQNAYFRVSREETTTFAGDWEPLRGKTVRIIWVEPSSDKPSSPRAKLDFAKSILLDAHKEVSAADQVVAGVVIVFDSADGGQIATTLASLKQWRAGNISEDSFWQQASLDPAESFHLQNKP